LVIAQLLGTSEFGRCCQRPLVGLTTAILVAGDRDVRRSRRFGGPPLPVRRK
jgi:hypothetical protein